MMALAWAVSSRYTSFAARHVLSWLERSPFLPIAIRRSCEICGDTQVRQSARTAMLSTFDALRSDAHSKRDVANPLLMTRDRRGDIVQLHLGGSPGVTG